MLPWWLGGLLLAGMVLLYAWWIRRPLGVSARVGALVSREARDEERQLAGLDNAALEAALVAATQAQALASGGCDAPVMAVGAAESSAEGSAPPPPRVGIKGSATFIAGIVLGGLLAGYCFDALGLELAPSGIYAQFFGHDWRAYLALGLGGVFVGAGTAMAGGCTSGHGLVGCARLQVGSLVATASFFGTAIAVSFLLVGLLGGAP